MVRTTVACLCSSILASCAELGQPSSDGPATQASESSGAELVATPGTGIFSKKEIVSVQWMTRDFREKIDAAPSERDVGLWVKTRNYKAGEIITVVVGEEVDGLSVGNKSFSGAVDSQGNVRMLVDMSARAEVMAEAKLREMLNGLAREAPQKLNWATSVVDFLKLLGQDSSLAAREQVATERHYSGAKGDSAARNVWMHRQVMNKLVANGGKLPFTGMRAD